MPAHMLSIHTNPLSGQALSVICLFDLYVRIVLHSGSARGAIRLWGRSGRGCLLLLTLSPSPRSQVYADTSPFLKGPGLEGSSWLTPPVGAHLRFSTSLCSTQTLQQCHCLQSHALEAFSEIPKRKPPYCWVYPHARGDGSSRETTASGAGSD